MRGRQSCHGDRRAPTHSPQKPPIPPRQKGVATGTNQEPGDKKMDARYGNLAKRKRGKREGGRRGGRSLTGPGVKKVPRLDLDTTQRAAPSPPASPRLTSENSLYLPNY